MDEVKNVFLCTYPDAERIESLLLELFPLLDTEINENHDLEIYMTKKEYVYVLSQLQQFPSYLDSLPKDYEEEFDTLIKQPIMMHISNRYEILFDVMIECELTKEHKED